MEKGDNFGDSVGVCTNLDLQRGVDHPFARHALPVHSLLIQLVVVFDWARVVAVQNLIVLEVGQAPWVGARVTQTDLNVVIRIRICLLLGQQECPFVEVLAIAKITLASLSEASSCFHAFRRH